MSSDGALGLGKDVYEQSNPKLVEYFLVADSVPIRVQCIAAGADNSGSHSAAVSIDGQIYSWGLGCATGTGTTKPQFLPNKIHVSDTPANSFAKITCGGSFCLAMTKCGSLFSWGKWQNGRLGKLMNCLCLLSEF